MLDYGSIPTIDPRKFGNARLFANRQLMLDSMPSFSGAVCAEIGVARGDFSESIITHFNPTEFHAFDTFTMHQAPAIWGILSSEFFSGMTQLEYYNYRLSKHKTKLVVHEGPSQARLAECADAYFDYIYVDGDHSYRGVLEDAILAMKKIKRGGIIVFNDYIIFQGPENEPYGVVAAANKIINEHNVEVVGLSLQRHMYCDLAIVAL